MRRESNASEPAEPGTAEYEARQMRRELSFADGFFAPIEFGFEVEIGAESDVGQVRENNEDHYAIIKRTRHCEMVKTNLPDDNIAYVNQESYGMLVADGVGGENFGQFASQLVLETICQSASQATSWLMKFKDFEANDTQERIEAYVGQIQNAFKFHSQLDIGKSNMGTTLTLAYLMPPHVVIAHIGDSRAYVLRDSQLKQVTNDHTVAQELIDRGADAETVQGLRHILINSLSPTRSDVDVDVMHLELKTGDRLLLCTDGLSDMVDSSSIIGVMESHKPQSACEKLIKLANEAGGRDNITVLVAEMLD